MTPLLGEKPLSLLSDRAAASAVEGECGERGLRLPFQHEALTQSPCVYVTTTLPLLALPNAQILHPLGHHSQTLNLQS